MLCLTWVLLVYVLSQQGPKVKIQNGVQYVQMWQTSCWGLVQAHYASADLEWQQLSDVCLGSMHYKAD